MLGHGSSFHDDGGDSGGDVDDDNDEGDDEKFETA